MELKILNYPNGEAITDILLVCANKPINFSHLKTLNYGELWKIAKSFAIARRHSEEAIDTAIQTIQDAIMHEKLPDLIEFSGIKVPKEEEKFASELYYAREQFFQELLYKLSEDKIKQSIIDTLGSPTTKARQRECQIVRTFVQYLNDVQFYGQPIASLPIEIEKFKHHYGRMFGKEMPAEITTSLIVDVLQMARLGFEYDCKFYPFWYTFKKYSGLQFRKMLDEMIAARMA